MSPTHSSVIGRTRLVLANPDPLARSRNEAATAPMSKAIRVTPCLSLPRTIRRIGPEAVAGHGADGAVTGSTHIQPRRDVLS
jgi:hypothetical protein